MGCDSGGRVLRLAESAMNVALGLKILAYILYLTSIVLCITGLTSGNLPASKTCDSGSVLKTVSVADLVKQQSDTYPGFGSQLDASDIDNQIETLADIFGKTSGLDDTVTLDKDTPIYSYCARRDSLIPDWFSWLKTNFGLNQLGFTDEEFTDFAFEDDYAPALKKNAAVEFLDIFYNAKMKSHVEEDETPSIDDICAASTETSYMCTSALLPKDSNLVLPPQFFQTTATGTPRCVQNRCFGQSWCADTSAKTAKLVFTPDDHDGGRKARRSITRERSGAAPMHVDARVDDQDMVGGTKLTYISSDAKNPPDVLVVGSKHYNITDGLVVEIPIGVEHGVRSTDPKSRRVFTATDATGVQVGQNPD